MTSHEGGAASRDDLKSFNASPCAGEADHYLSAFIGPLVLETVAPRPGISTHRRSPAIIGPNHTAYNLFHCEPAWCILGCQYQGQ
jgi:hypothetical protein